MPPGRRLARYGERVVHVIIESVNEDGRAFRSTMKWTERFSRSTLLIRKTTQPIMQQLDIADSRDVVLPNGVLDQLHRRDGAAEQAALEELAPSI
ncbi:hypothetical protein [Paraburkholderia largidicola]|uniref:Uncharacterized protein n=1 Tax=Paraburkholderia largidicola TaxID=3014751 RepID=A0A7I8C1I3_9BURK|nr:hypothetical protein [Paraburkholderia sp. PGU16]BCF94946.1 hypothetical protein PPGU16_80130 [Paraburkholderia sp. PGU16]